MVWSRRRTCNGSASMTRRPRSARLRTSRSSTRRWSRSDSARTSSSRAFRRPDRRTGPAWPGSRSVPRIVVIGVRSSWLMTSMNDSRNSPARRSSTRSRSRCSSTTMAFGESCPVPSIEMGRPSSSTSSRPAPCVQWIDPSGQTTRKSRLNGSPPLGRGPDRRAERLAIVGMDDRDISGMAAPSVRARARAGGRSRRTRSVRRWSRPTPRSRSPTLRA